MKKSLSLVKQAGIGLLELMLSLAIIAVLLIMATRYYQAARLSQQVNDAISLTSAIAGASQNWVLGQGNFTGISFAALKKQGLIPAGIADNAANATPWHTALDLASTTDGSKIVITLNQIPQEACYSLETKLQGQIQDTTGTDCATSPAKFVATM